MDYVDLIQELRQEREKYEAMAETLGQHLPAPDADNKLAHMAGQMDGIAYGIDVAIKKMEG